MNDAEFAQKYIALMAKTKAATKRYLATEKGSLKCRETQRNNYHAHTADETYLEKRRQVAKLFYDNNEAYRENRKKVSRAKYQEKKLLKDSTERSSVGLQSTENISN